MEDIECPYCEEYQEINHDDGRGYEEDKLHQQQCTHCEKYFVFETYISYSYTPYKSDCLNDGDHIFKATRTFPIAYTKMKCVDCGEIRNPTKEEMEIIMQGNKP